MSHSSQSLSTKKGKIRSDARFEDSMLTWRTPWWMYIVAAAYVLTFFFNARQEAWGPANAGWVPSWPTFRVAGVVPGGPMDNAGLRVGDILQAVDGQPLSGMAAG